MTGLALIRHGTTDWNARGLIQGSTDIPLNAQGRTEVSGWTLPSRFAGYDLLASPLSRAIETAELVAGRAPGIDPRLSEMCWGSWEGRTLSGLRDEIGDLMIAWEARGLDFHGPGGESPRDVQNRVMPLLRELAQADKPTVAVTHRGVIRSIYALATGWDMESRPEVRPADYAVQLFSLDIDGQPHIQELNISMSTVSDLTG